MNQFHIIKLLNLEDHHFLKEFSEFPKSIRSKDYNDGLIPEDLGKKLVHWGYSNGSQFWLLKDKENQVVLRISFRKSKSQEKTGTIGFFEIDLNHADHEKAFRFVVQEIEKELSLDEIKTIYAPIDLNTWFNYRFSLPGKKFFPRYQWEPTTPPAYLELFEKMGYQRHVQFNSVFFPNFRIGSFAPGTGHLKKSYQRLNQLGYTLRPFNMRAFFEEEVPLFHEISHDAFADAFLFEPIDLDTFSSLYAAAKVTYDFSPSCVLITPEGDTAGFLFAFFDKDTLVIKSIALRKKYQGLKLSSGMIYSAIKLGFEKNKKITVSALVRTGITSEKIAGNSQKWAWLNWVHDYLLVKKDLP
jgi:hypothetical protein